MCHFYANPLSLLCDTAKDEDELLNLLQPEHLEAVRMLPSFRNLIEATLDKHDATHARDLLEDDELLKEEIKKSLQSRDIEVVKLIRSMYVLTTAAVDYVGKIELYLKAIRGTLNDSDTVRGVLDAVKRMSPETLLSFLNRIQEVIENGKPESDIDGWANEEPEFLGEIFGIQAKVTALTKESTDNDLPIRSSYAAHSKGLRTTVIAQKVHLSYEKSTLSKQDIEFTALVDHLLEVLKEYFTFDNPQHLFLSEVWIYDSTLPYKDVFTPRPRFAIERALSSPKDYLPNCKSGSDSLSAAKPPTANLYQMYLESGSLINISDLWTAFFSMVGGDEGKGEGCDERTALMLFYRGLADLKLLGMIKQSKKKVDHLAKSAWGGL
jgi:origin recognition complex subunit 3